MQKFIDQCFLFFLYISFEFNDKLKTESYERKLHEPRAWKFICMVFLTIVKWENWFFHFQAFTCVLKTNIYVSHLPCRWQTCSSIYTLCFKDCATFIWNKKKSYRNDEKRSNQSIKKKKTTVSFSLVFKFPFFLTMICWELLVLYSRITWNGNESCLQMKSTHKKKGKFQIAFFS